MRGEKDKRRGLDRNEGEGSTSAARKYDDEVESFVQKLRERGIELLAGRAARDLEQDTGELAAAEAIGRSKKQVPRKRRAKPAPAAKAKRAKKTAAPKKKKRRAG
jgi:hypothetical protein